MQDLIKPLLTIAIPTYNRENEILSQVGRLLPQISSERVELLIVDNGSDFNVKQTITERFPYALKHIRFIRNRYNLGLGGNILRAFELAEGEWMWLLGDDDPIYPEAVDTIFEAILNDCRDVLMIKFGGDSMVPPIHNEQRLKGIKGIASHINSAWRYSSILAISTSVFRTKHCAVHMSQGYHWNYSLAPHLALLFSALSYGGEVRLLPQQLIQQQRGHWNGWRLIMGTATLGEIEGCEIIAQSSLPTIYKDWSGKRWWLAYPAIMLRSRDRPASYWKMYCFRIAGSTSGPLQWYLIFCALFIVPLINWHFSRNLIHKLLGTRSDLRGLNRS